MNFQSWIFCLIVISCATTIAVHGAPNNTSAPTTGPAMPNNGTNHDSNEKIFLPYTIKLAFFTIVIDDVIATYREKLALQELMRAEIALVKVRAEELAVTWLTAALNEILAEIKVFIELILVLLEELTLSNIQIKYLEAREELSIDRQYQIAAFHMDAALIPYIRQTIFQLRRFINAKIVHQRRLQLLLRHLNIVASRYAAQDSKIANQAFIARKEAQEAVQARAILDIAAVLARNFFRFESIEQDYFRDVDEIDLAGNEILSLGRQFFILSKMAILHAREVEVGVIIDLLRQINFALVADERHQLRLLRIVDRQRFIELRKIATLIYPLRRNLRHILYAMIYHDAQVAKVALQIEGAVELMGVGEVLDATWDYSVLNWNCLHLVSL